MRVGDKDVHSARKYMKHAKMIADLTKNALQQQTSTKQDMARFSKKCLHVPYPELSYHLEMKKSFITCCSGKCLLFA